MLLGAAVSSHAEPMSHIAQREGTNGVDLVFVPDLRGSHCYD